VTDNGNKEKRAIGGRHAAMLVRVITIYTISQCAINSNRVKLKVGHTSPMTLHQGCTNVLGQRAKFASGQSVEGHKSACTLLSEKKKHKIMT